MSKATTANRKTEIPSLSQSKQALMACPELYVQCAILGRRVDTPWAERGQQIHEALSTYISHLVRTRQTTDLDYLRELIAQIGNQEAAEVLETFAEQQPMFDPERVLGTEMHIELDENFMPVGDLTGDPADAPTVFEGRLDLVQLESPTAALIDDFKSYFRMIAPDTFQGKLYSLLLFASNPALEKVRFRLNFVRYGVSREVTYTRRDVEKLRKEVERERKRQLDIHEAHNRSVFLDVRVPLAAFPGGHCVYCPLLQTGECPVRHANPMVPLDEITEERLEQVARNLNIPPEKLQKDESVRLFLSRKIVAEDRLKFRLWLDAQAKENDEGLKAWVGEQGPVEYQDANGVRYAARFEPKEKTRYPLEATYAVLNTFCEPGLTGKLYVGSSELKPLLKSKKRAALAVAVGNVAEVSTVTDFKVGKVKEQAE